MQVVHHLLPSFLSSLPSFAIVFAIVFVAFVAVSRHFCCHSLSFLSSSPLLAVVFAVVRRHLCHIFLIVRRCLHRRRRLCCPFYAFYQQPRLNGVCILVVRYLPTGPQLWSASFQSTNFTYAGPQVRILPVPEL